MCVASPTGSSATHRQTGLEGPTGDAGLQVPTAGDAGLLLTSRPRLAFCGQVLEQEQVVAPHAVESCSLNTRVLIL